jgi:hypothetical protein
MIEEFYGFLSILMKFADLWKDDEVQGIESVWIPCEIGGNVCENLHFGNFATFGENAGFGGVSGGP